MSSRYSFRDRTKAVRAEVELKEEAAKQRKRKDRELERTSKPKKIVKAVKKVKRATATAVKETVVEVQEKPAPSVKIPGLTLLEGKTLTIELPNLSIPAHKSPPTAVGETIDTAVQAFDTSIRAYLASVDACRDWAPETNPPKRKLRGTVEKQQQIQEAFERALAFQESATESLASATDSLALGKYFLNVYADAKVPLGQPMKFGLRSFLPGLSEESASPIDGFPWIKMDWSEGMEDIDWGPHKLEKKQRASGTPQWDWPGTGASHEPSPIVSPQSTPHTLSIHLLPDGSSSLEPIKVYSKTFDHRISTCPHPSLCPLCQYRGSEGPVQIAMFQSVKTPRVIVSPPELPSKLEAKPDISSDRKESLVSLEEGRSRSLQTPPPNASHMSHAVPPTSPPGAKGTRMVEVSIFHTKGNLVGEPRKLETCACDSFDDFKEQIEISFEDLFAESQIPFKKVIYDQLVLFNEGQSILNTEFGNTLMEVWNEFISLLEARKVAEDDAKGVVGSVEIFLD